ncbi:hypothetical protein EBU24_03345 [bacterium]|nr:hypothetical protein [bacterium]
MAVKRICCRKSKTMKAIDWLFNELWESPKDKFTWHSILSKAKELEKQQIIDAVSYGNSYYKNYEAAEVTGEKYYKETYSK